MPTDNTKESTPVVQDTAGVVKIDIDGEVIRMAKRAGVPMDKLDKEVITTPYVQFSEAVKNFYTGKDKGYEEGYGAATRDHRPMLPVYTFLIGASAYPLIKLIVKFIILCVHFYNS